MAKFTRRSYRRRKLFVGICLFASMALISTGFASWIISLNASGGIDGDLIVGTVTDSSVTITIDNAEVERTINFGAQSSDTTGRIRYDSNNPDDVESLSHTITGKITNTQFVSKVTAKLVVPESVKAAAEAGYITLPEWTVTSEDAEPASYLDLTPQTKEGTQNLSVNLTVGWGTKFGGHNPGIYYDSHAEGKLKTDAEMITELATFRKTILGITDDNLTEKQLLEAAVPSNFKFKLIIEAEVN